MKKYVFVCMLLIMTFFVASGNAAPEYRLDNGHVYDIVYLQGASDPYPVAVSLAASRNAHLVTITSAAEQAWMASSLAVMIAGGNAAWTGGVQNRMSPFYSEPGGGWEWVTGEAWWQPNSFYDNHGGYQDNLMLHYNFAWDDTSLGEYTGSRQYAALEWDSLADYYAIFLYR